jgi:hypothetical protein
METKEARKQQALARVDHNELLLETYQLEKESIDLLIDQALDFPASANRWQAYSALKKQVSLITGWHAAHRSLMPSIYYEVLINFVDYLLPQSINEDEIPTASLYIDNHEVDAWFQRAEQVLETRQDYRKTHLATNDPERLQIEQDLDELFKMRGF